jgi:predicted ATPase
LTVLATSRIRLRLRGEQVYLVAPLAYPEAVETGGCHGVAGFSESPAVELFRRRAQAVRPEFDLTAENIAAVVAICRRLDGLPLAIELAAAWVRVLSPDQLLRRLAQPLDALGTAARDVPRRQRTLRDTIAWSHDLLAPQERTLFRRLSVFVGGCTIEGVEAIAAGTEGDALETVAALVDHSLLSTRPGVDGPSSRYAMLETIREFAAEQLEASGEHTDVHAAFEAHLLDLAERAESGLRGSEQLRWLDRLEEEHANVRAVLGTALDRGNGEVALALAPRLWLFWRTRGYSAEGHTWLERVLEASPRAAPAQSAVARFALGKLSVDLGDYAGADRHFRVSADLWRDTGNDELLAGALSALTTVKLNVGELDEAEVLGQEALAISRQFGDEINIATALLNLGMIARVGGRADRALDLLGQSLDIWRQLSDPDAIALTLMNLGMVYHAAGQVARATSLLAECAELYARLGDRFHLGVVAQHLGHIDREARRYEEAMWRYAESLRHFDAVGSSEGVVESVEWIAVTATEHGLARPALRLFGAAAAARDALRLVPLEAERLVVNASKTQALRELGEPAGPEELAAGGALPLALAADEALALANPTAARAAR